MGRTEGHDWGSVRLGKCRELEDQTGVGRKDRRGTLTGQERGKGRTSTTGVMSSNVREKGRMAWQRTKFWGESQMEGSTFVK